MVVTKFINPYRLDIIDDSLTQIFQFDNNDVYKIYNTIDYDSEGPQPKEVKYKYIIE